MKIKLQLDEETRPLWEAALRAKAEVAAWPAWKHTEQPKSERMKCMQVLDHGSLTMIESWGSDERIIESARMSTTGAFNGWGTAEKPGDERLLRYLWKNQHTSPFEMAGATFEVVLPMFIGEQWLRHRTLSYNKFSGRYSEFEDPQFYVPAAVRVMADGGTNKQAAGRLQVSGKSVDDFIHDVRISANIARLDYNDAVSRGVPRELARILLPANVYTKMRVSGNLLNWLKFLRLRTASDAQWEIQEYARAVQTQLEDVFPRTMQIYKETDNV